MYLYVVPVLNILTFDKLPDNKMPTEGQCRNVYMAISLSLFLMQSFEDHNGEGCSAPHGEILSI